VFPEGWKKSRNYLERKFVFKDFKEALKFVNKVGKIAERIQHHPDIIMQNWNQVIIRTITHDVGYKVTNRDIKLAKLINHFYEE
jgi:4a-hydroxytetrahydrobiopterin dehydratase